MLYFDWKRIKFWGPSHKTYSISVEGWSWLVCPSPRDHPSSCARLCAPSFWFESDSRTHSHHGHSLHQDGVNYRRVTLQHVWLHTGRAGTMLRRQEIAVRKGTGVPKLPYPVVMESEHFEGRRGGMSCGRLRPLWMQHSVSPGFATGTGTAGRGPL